MKIKSIIFLIAFLFFAVSVHAEDCYYLTYNSQTIAGGPFYEIDPNWSHCKDWCGSGLYKFDTQCFIDQICYHIGNGFFYPKGTPFPPYEADSPTPIVQADCSCVKQKKCSNLKSGYYYLEYTPIFTWKGPFGHWYDCVNARKIESKTHLVNEGLCQGIGIPQEQNGPTQ